jgi:hypothetical protein
MRVQRSRITTAAWDHADQSRRRREWPLGGRSPGALNSGQPRYLTSLEECGIVNPRRGTRTRPGDQPQIDSTDPANALVRNRCFH